MGRQVSWLEDLIGLHIQPLSFFQVPKGRISGLISVLDVLTGTFVCG